MLDVLRFTVELVMAETQRGLSWCALEYDGVIGRRDNRLIQSMSI